MIQCSFLQSAETSRCIGFVLQGHAFAGQPGSDIVCAAVSSAAFLTANAVTDVLHVRAQIRQKDGLLQVFVQEADEPKCRSFFKALRLHMENLKDEYPKNISISDKRCKKC